MKCTGPLKQPHEKVFKWFEAHAKVSKAERMIPATVPQKAAAPTAASQASCLVGDQHLPPGPLLPSVRWWEDVWDLLLP